MIKQAICTQTGLARAWHIAVDSSKLIFKVFDIITAFLWFLKNGKQGCQICGRLCCVMQVLRFVCVLVSKRRANPKCHKLSKFSAPDKS